MSFRPCVLIPCYDHGSTVIHAVEQLRDYGLTLFIVDDGSHAPTQELLNNLAKAEPWIRLFRLDTNQGKGAAVMRAMRAAYAEGFTHGLQVDADGQHTLADVSKFLALAEAHPGKLICGKPVYDHSVPKSRLYGRYLTHVWVWIETLSFAIGDSMCGFRCYPLDVTVRLINQWIIPTRMDFDIEIVVLLYWEGLDIINVPTRVIYPKDGLSHFDAVRDNLRISAMHTRLFFSMLPRIPKLVARWFRRTDQHWAHIGERGSLLGLKIILWLYRLLGPRIVKRVLHVVVAYFFLTGQRSRAASRQFLERVQLKASPRVSVSSGLIYRHFYAFAESAVDKMGAWLGEINERVEYADQATLNTLIDSGQGALFVGAHLGNLEMCRALAHRAGRKQVNAVVYSEHAARFTELLRQSNPDFSVNLIHVQDMGVDTVMLLKDKVDNGEWVVIVGDRTPASENGRVEVVDFLGAPASFAQGPWILASVLECPVYLFLCLKRQNAYQVVLEPFAERIELPRRERQARLHSVIEHYAKRLEHYACLAPLQWFNFYDFWRPEARRESY